MNILENLENLKVSEACFNDILILVENYIKELDDSTYRKTREMAKAIADEQEKALPSVKGKDNREFVEKDIVKRRRQAAKADDKYERQVVERAKKEYEESKKKEKN